MAGPRSGAYPQPRPRLAVQAPPRAGYRLKRLCRPPLEPTHTAALPLYQPLPAHHVSKDRGHTRVLACGGEVFPMILVVDVAAGL